MVLWFSNRGRGGSGAEVTRGRGGSGAEVSEFPGGESCMCKRVGNNCSHLENEEVARFRLSKCTSSAKHYGSQAEPGCLEY